MSYTGYAEVFARLRRESGKTQAEVAAFISKHSEKPYSFKMISHWEKGVSMPPVEQFLLLCEFYGVGDIQNVFRGVERGHRGWEKLNELGKNRAGEYISMLAGNPLFSYKDISDPTVGRIRSLKLYDIPVAAGFGEYLDGDSFVDLEIDGTVPKGVDFAVKVSGDSMTPRFVDGQVVFIKEQNTLDIGDIGIFELAGDSYIKKLGRGELISLNQRYSPIKIGEFDSFRIFGKVVG